jgi:CDP-diacylglycerol--glycerol-3-phosphate 3-phosphatidyltransferase/cardiolipin synthase
MYTIPNLLTLGRLLLLLPICLAMTGGWAFQALAFVLYVIAALSDYVDGWIARNFNQASDLGRIMDPVVDKIFVAALFMMLVATETIAGLWLACPIIILGREFLVAGLREYLGPRGITLPVTRAAKWKTTLQMVAIGFMLFPGLQEPGLFLLLIATILTITTGAGYVRAAIRAA